MNIESFCRVRTSTRDNINTKIRIDRNNIIVGQLNGPSHKFSGILSDHDDGTGLYRVVMDPLVNSAINGFNAGLILFGEIGSGRSYTLSEQDANKRGLFYYTMTEVFRKLEIDSRFRSAYRVAFSICEVHNDVIVDLLKLESPAKMSQKHWKYSPDQGFYVEGLTQIEVTSGAQSNLIFHDCWTKRTHYNKFDPDNQVTVIIRIKLYLKNFEETNSDTISQISFVIPPGDEGLAYKSTYVSLEKKSTGVMKIKELIDRGGTGKSIEYSSERSILPDLLQDELGGNCITRALLCLPPEPDPRILTQQIVMLSNLTEKVTCSPLKNTRNARLMLNTLYCCKEFGRQKFEGSGAGNKGSNGRSRNDMSMLEILRSTEKENVELKDKVEDLLGRLKKANNTYTHLNFDKVRMGDQLVISETEKLRASKHLIEMDIENERLRDNLASVEGNLSNKLSMAEQNLSKALLERNIYKQDSEQLNKMKEERRLNNDELMKLRRTVEQLEREKSFLVAQVKELRMEFINKPKNGSGIGSKIQQLREELSELHERNNSMKNSITKMNAECAILTKEKEYLKAKASQLMADNQKLQDHQKHSLKKYLHQVSALLDSEKVVTNSDYKNEIIRMLQMHESIFKQREKQMEHYHNQLKSQYYKMRKWCQLLLQDNQKLKTQSNAKPTKPEENKRSSSADVLLVDGELNHEMTRNLKGNDYKLFTHFHSSDGEVNFTKDYIESRLKRYLNMEESNLGSGTIN